MEPSYKGFAERAAEADMYVSYQDKYRYQPKECEKVTARLIRERVRLDRTLRLLDVGCSTGNFIRYLSEELPNFSFVGIDLMPQAIEKAELLGLERAWFNVGDILDDTVDPPEDFDVVTFQTVVYAMTDDEFARALGCAYDALNPGGICVIFDYFHEWEANYTIVERSTHHPDGHPLHFRPLSLLRRLAGDVGFEVAEVQKFRLPDGFLPRGIDPHDLNTYSERGELFRGPLAQPFCHVVLRA